MVGGGDIPRRQNTARKGSLTIREGTPTVRSFHETTTNISGTVQDLRRRLNDLEADIKADKLGKKSFEDTIAEHNRRKQDLSKSIALNEKWIENFAHDVGPFQQKYTALVQDIHNIYDNAKEFHAKGIQMLVDEFNYHQAYKRYNDTFTAVPFKPK